MARPKLLAVDDVVANLVTLERVLEELDVEVIRANSGDEALRCVVKHDFALILMDVLMPGLSGVETAELIRQDPPSANIPIIFITAQDPSDELTFRGYAVGAVDHLYKPLHAEVLLSKVRVFLRLYNQRAQLEAARQDFEQFAHMASHDLRAPLRQIRCLTEIITADHNDGMDADGREIQQRIVDVVGRAERLVSGLLAFARGGQVLPNSGPVELGEVFEDVMLDLAELVEQSGARVDLEKLPTVYGDRGLLYQVFQNIVANAIKYRRPDVPLEVTVGASETPAETTITVSDNGLGFSQHKAKQMFRPFTRLVGRETAEGSGIGLATVKRIVEKHGGTVEAFGEPDKGARFIVRLPTSQPAPAPAPMED